MSRKNPGRNSVNATSSSTTDSQILFFTNRNPCVAEANNIIATTATPKTKNAFPTDTSISSNSVLKMNRNGSNAVRIS